MARWFAWYPVRIYNRKWVWLRYVRYEINITSWTPRGCFDMGFSIRVYYYEDNRKDQK